MRMPWVPIVQSRGCEAEVKFVRRVTEVESVGSSERETGAKRWSSNALHKKGNGQLACRDCHFL